MADQIFSGYKKEISAYLEQFFREQTAAQVRFPLDREIFRILQSFVIRGKMFRGSLILFISDLFPGENERVQAIKAAAALELLESGILIQDDVMDRDEKRRGMPSAWAHFRDSTKDVGTDPVSFGQSVAVCAGDVCYFLAYSILGGLRLSGDKKSAVLEAFSREMSLLSLSQAQDLYLSATTRNVTPEETLEMYAAKTARYSFVLPFEIGLILTGRLETLGAQFKDIGSSLGMVYQLTDDKIGLFGDEKQTGKSVGGDVREGKKTLYWHHARMLMSPADRMEFDSIYGRHDITNQDVRKIQELVRSSGALEKAEKLKEKYFHEAESGISSLSVPEAQKKQLHKMIGFICRREK